MSVNDRDLTITRILDATPARVFKAWTDPEQVPFWWGPHGFSITRCEQDVRPGGSFLRHMKGPDGVVRPMQGEYLEVVENERLVMITAIPGPDGNPSLEIRGTVTFAPHEGGKTKLTLTASVVNAPPWAAPAVDGMAEGWKQTLDRLGEYVRNG